MGGMGDMGGNILGSMLAPRNEPYNYGLGPPPGDMSDRMRDLQRKCSSGYGWACNELQIATQQHQNNVGNYYRNLEDAQRRSQGGGVMSAGSRGGW
jgi:hypothetical protein